MTASRRAELALGWVCYHLYRHLPRRIAFGPIGLVVLCSAATYAYAGEPPVDPAADDDNTPF